MSAASVRTRDNLPVLPKAVGNKGERGSAPSPVTLRYSSRSSSSLWRPVKTWGSVDGRGHAMFGWPMEEEAKLEFTITVNCRREDGSIATTQLATLARGACRSAEDVGLQLADAKPILRRCGRGQDTDLRILSDGEDGLRGVVGTWFGKKCQHRL